jgi:tyrosinase
MLTAYAKAVSAMKALPLTDTTSWAYQAAMHGTHATPKQNLWNGCKHRSWFFVAWHRMFLYYLESIVRTHVLAEDGPSNWALPYWNYGLGGANATLPEPFRDPSTDSNPLYVAEREAFINEGGELEALIISPARALERPNFVGAVEFGGGEAPPGPQFWTEPGELEQTPHNDVHGAIGGWMGDPDQAAQDPIFWLHHANIDRIWALWVSEGHQDPSQADWTGQQFDFYDDTGTLVSLTCSQVLDPSADLGYIYDKLEADPALGPQPSFGGPTPTEPTPTLSVPSGREPEIVGASEQPLTLVGAAAKVPVAIDARAEDQALTSMAASEPQRVLLHLENIEAQRNPGSVYGIYVNLPEGADAQQRADHYAGNLSFFGIEHANEPPGDEHRHGMRISTDITDLARHLKEQGQWKDGALDVTLLPIRTIPPKGAAQAPSLTTATHEETPVTIGRVSVSYA